MQADRSGRRRGRGFGGGGVEAGNLLQHRGGLGGVVHPLHGHYVGALFHFPVVLPAISPAPHRPQPPADFRLVVRDSWKEAARLRLLVYCYTFGATHPDTKFATMCDMTI